VSPAYASRAEPRIKKSASDRLDHRLRDPSKIVSFFSFFISSIPRYAFLLTGMERSESADENPLARSQKPSNTPLLKPRQPNLV
jgi:hypothetical protein